MIVLCEKYDKITFDTDSIDMLRIYFKVQEMNSLNVYKNRDCLLTMAFLFHSEFYINSLTCIKIYLSCLLYLWMHLKLLSKLFYRSFKMTFIIKRGNNKCKIIRITTVSPKDMWIPGIKVIRITFKGLLTNLTVFILVQYRVNGRSILCVVMLQSFI